MTIEEYLKSIGKNEYIAKRNEYITQPNVEVATQHLQFLNTDQNTGDKKFDNFINETFKELYKQKSYLYLSLIKITPVAEYIIKEVCKSVDDFYNYLWGKDKYLFNRLIDDCLYPDEINATNDILEIYLHNWNVYIKNSKVGDKNIQLAAYTKIQQTLINRSIDTLIKTTEKVSQESSDTSQAALLEAKKSNRTAKIALLIAGITGVASIVVGVLSYISSEKTDNSQMYTLSGINNQLVDIKNTINSFSGSYKQSAIEDKLNQQIEILKKINSKK